MKVLTFIGTRPEIIRLSRIIALLDHNMDHVVVHTGQNYDYELNEIFFDDLEIRKPNYFLEAAGETPMETIGNVLSKGDKVLEIEKPDALLILGDTNSSLIAIAAKRRKIPIFHMEAGNRCFDFRVPEEINRKIVDHISDINLPYSAIAREYLILEGFPINQIVKTGSPMGEVLKYYSSKIEESSILQKMGLFPEKYFLVSSHREENVDTPQRLQALIDLLIKLKNEYDMPIVFSTHPRTRKKLERLGGQTKIDGIVFSKPLCFSDYVKLQIKSKLTLSDSGTITEESSILNFPAINIRDIHERPEGMEEASVMFAGLNVQRILEAIAILEHQPRNEDRLLNQVQDYETENVSEKILRIILSYKDFVDQFIWKKPASS
jgi:UDP-N-acetylglucosamine 2-epimerase